MSLRNSSALASTTSSVRRPRPGSGTASTGPHSSTRPSRPRTTHATRPESSAPTGASRNKPTSTRSSRPSTVGGRSRRDQPAGAGPLLLQPAEPTQPMDADLRRRADEYMRRNSELEARNAELARQADEVFLRQQQQHPLMNSLFSEPETTLVVNDELQQSFSSVNSNPAALADLEHEWALLEGAQPAAHETAAQPATGQRSRPTSRGSRPSSASGIRSPQKRANLAHKKATKLAGAGGAELDIDPRGDAVLEAVSAGHLGDEASLRFLKAKLKVMQEELDALHEEIADKNAEIKQLSSKAKAVNADHSKQNKALAAAKAQADAAKREVQEHKRNAEASKLEAASLKKQLDQIERAQKQDAQAHAATEVRLNRAMDNVADLKRQLQERQSSTKESASQLRDQLDEATAESKRLQKQNAQLVTAFKKQLKLIDVLKRQKLHVEAAKMLSFTEEEFVKALEWGT
eukprot:m.45947 g.45947  ORF g.45947 m.45947 type:complete len:462 (+) comp11817_c0_seq1:53-1438(+)